MPVEYIIKANLRVNGGEFAKTLLGDQAWIRAASTAASPARAWTLGQTPEYDPQSAAMESAYVAAFNDYAHTTLHYGADPSFGDGYMEYRVSAHSIGKWSFTHKQPDQRGQARGEPNVLPDLAAAMKANPALQVMLNQAITISARLISRACMKCAICRSRVRSRRISRSSNTRQATWFTRICLLCMKCTIMFRSLSQGHIQNRRNILEQTGVWGFQRARGCFRNFATLGGVRPPAPCFLAKECR